MAGCVGDMRNSSMERENLLPNNELTTFEYVFVITHIATSHGMRKVAYETHQENEIFAPTTPPKMTK